MYVDVRKQHSLQLSFYSRRVKTIKKGKSSYNLSLHPVDPTWMSWYQSHPFSRLTTFLSSGLFLMMLLWQSLKIFLFLTFCFSLFLCCISYGCPLQITFNLHFLYSLLFIPPLAQDIWPLEACLSKPQAFRPFSWSNWVFFFFF